MHPYKAYLDFVTTEPSVEYCTIDTDCGCGVIRTTVPTVHLADVPQANAKGPLWARPI
jgi:hypothetical protein